MIQIKKRTVSFLLKPEKEQKRILGCLTYAASKLWNVGNYERRSWTSDSGFPYPDWYRQKKALKDHFWYKALPSQSAQEVLKQLSEAWKSYVALKQNGKAKYILNLRGISSSRLTFVF